MTTLKEQLRADVTKFRKAGDRTKVDVLNLVLSEVSSLEKQGKTAVVFNDDKVLEVISRQVKQIRAAADKFAEGGETERAEAERAEALFLTAYLPVQLSEDEVRAIAEPLLKNAGVTHMGQGTGLVMKQVKGKASGAVVSKVVAEILG